MESRIAIDIDHEGRPYIWLDYKQSDDLRDKVLGRFLISSGVWMRKEGEINLPLSLQIIHEGPDSGIIQAMIEPAGKDILGAIKCHKGLADALEAVSESLNLLAAKCQIQVEGAKLQSSAPDDFGCIRSLDLANEALKSYRASN